MARAELPEVQVCLRLHCLLHFVWQITEEVDTRTFLKLIDGDGIVSIVLVVIAFILVLCPESYGVIRVCCLVVVQQRHVEVQSISEKSE